MDDFLDIEVRPARDIAARVLILFAVNQRLLLEDLVSQEEIDEEDDPDELYFDLNVFLDEAGVRSHLTASEASWFGTPPGSLREPELADLTDAAASLTPLLAAVTSDSPERAIDLGETNLRTFAGTIQIPSDEQAADIREIAELELWRVAMEQELRQASPVEAREIRALIQETAQEAKSAGLINVTRNGDFAIGDKPLADLNDIELTVLTIELTARLRAMNWLCGFGDSWDDVPLDV